MDVDSESAHPTGKSLPRAEAEFRRAHDQSEGGRHVSGRGGGCGGARGRRGTGVVADKAKRGPSPTELPKEDKKANLRLAKRPSLKRRLRSSDEKDGPSTHS